MSNTADDFLLGGGGKSASFENIGDSITGVIVSTEVKQQTSIADNTPLTWDNGDPKMQLVVKLQTTERTDDDDDGIRAVYVKGSKKAGSRSLHDAVATAVRNAGGKGLEVGGTLTVTHDGEEPSQTRGFNPRKLYSASYKAPDGAAQAGQFLGTTPAAQPAAPVAAPANGFLQSQQLTPEQALSLNGQQAPAAAPAVPALTPEQLAAFQQYQAQQAAQV